MLVSALCGSHIHATFVSVIDITPTADSPSLTLTHTIFPLFSPFLLLLLLLLLSSSPLAANAFWSVIAPGQFQIRARLPRPSSRVPVALFLLQPEQTDASAVRQ